MIACAMRSFSLFNLVLLISFRRRGWIFGYRFRLFWWSMEFRRDCGSFASVYSMYVNFLNALFCMCCLHSCNLNLKSYVVCLAFASLRYAMFLFLLFFHILTSMTLFYLKLVFSNDLLFAHEVISYIWNLVSIVVLISIW